MYDNQGKAILRGDRPALVAGEQAVGGYYEGESVRELKVGKSEEVSVNIFKRNFGPYANTYFLRVTIANPIKTNMKTRYEIDLDRYTNETDFLRMVTIGAAAAAEDQNAKWGSNLNEGYIANLASNAARSLLHETQDADKTRGL